MERRDRNGRNREEAGGQREREGRGEWEAHYSFLFQWDELDCTVCWVLHRSMAFNGRF